MLSSMSNYSESFQPKLLSIKKINGKIESKEIRSQINREKESIQKPIVLISFVFQFLMNPILQII